MTDTTTTNTQWTKSLRQRIEDSHIVSVPKPLLWKLGRLLNFADVRWVDGSLSRDATFAVDGDLVLITDKLVAVATVAGLKEGNGFTVPRASGTAHVVVLSSGSLRRLEVSSGDPASSTASLASWDESDDANWPGPRQAEMTATYADTAVTLTVNEREGGRPEGVHLFEALLADLAGRE